MANLNETAVWEDGIYQLEQDDLVKGGADGIDNVQARQLANRTAFLKALVESLDTDKQDAGDTLSALAILKGSADTLSYFTGAKSAALTTFTAFARSLVAAADAAAARTVLGAASLEDIESSKLDLTAFARTLLVAADAASARTVLGATSQEEIEASIAALVDSSPAALNTLKELAAALGNDANFAATINTELSKRITKVDLQSATAITSQAEGTADAITATFSPAITTLTNGMALHVRAAAANATTAPTFTPANGIIVAKPIVKGSGSALAAGDIAGAGHWIELQYDATLDKWILQTPANGVNAPVPPGVVAMYAGATPPTGWLVRNGSAISRTTYAALFAVIGTLYGAGDGSTTFNLPNVPTGYTDTVGTPGSAVSIGQMPAHTHSMGCTGSGTSTGGTGGGAFSGQAGSTTTGSSGSGTVNLAAGLPQLAIIKY